MTELKERFSLADEIGVRELWGEARRRAAAPEAPSRTADWAPVPGRRLAAGAVALAVFATAAVFAWELLPSRRRAATPTGRRHVGESRRRGGAGMVPAAGSPGSFPGLGARLDRVRAGHVGRGMERPVRGYRVLVRRQHPDLERDPGRSPFAADAAGLRLDGARSC